MSIKHRSEDPVVQQSAKALPCPWCGSIKLKVLFTDEDVHRSTWVYCGGCSASGPIADGEIDAVHRWNVRILSLAAPKSSEKNPYLKCILVFGLLAFLTGCSWAPTQEPAASGSKIEITIENQTEQPVYAMLLTGSPFFSPTLTLAPHEMKAYWVIREYMPGSVRLVVVERKAEKR